MIKLVAQVSALLSLMRDGGYDLPFPLTDLVNRLDQVTIIEREGKVCGSARTLTYPALAFSRLVLP